MENPKISIIIPVYNSEEYLEECLDSVVAQTIQDVEIICINDGSSDHSLKILNEYKKKDKRIQVITQENAGAGAARNHGLRLAKGKYLSFLDADDFFERDMLEKAYKKIEEYQADFVVYESDQYYMDKKEFIKNPLTLRKKDIPPYSPFTHRELTDNVFKTFVGWAWDKLYRHEFVKQHNLWFQEQRTSNDLLFVFSALVLAKRIAVVEYKILAHQRRGETNSLSVTREKSWHCFYDALIALKKRLIEEDIYWELEQDYINYALHFSLWNLNTLAEPTKSLLKEKLKQEWFSNLGVEEKQEEYFYNKGEYRDYLELVKS